MFLAESNTGLMAFFGIYFIVIIALAIFMIVAMWKVFEKADQPGVASIIPFYNTYVMLEMGGMNGWLFLVAFIPIVGSIAFLIIFVMACITIAERFGKTSGFGLGLAFLGVIFFPILAFGDAVYVE